MPKKFQLMEGLLGFTSLKVKFLKHDPSVKKIFNFEKKFLTNKRFKNSKNVVLSKVYLYSLLQKLRYEE